MLCFVPAERELMLIKLRAPAGPARTEVLQLAEIFRARVVDVSERGITLCVSGDPGKVCKRPQSELCFEATIIAAAAAAMYVIPLVSEVSDAAVGRNFCSICVLMSVSKASYYVCVRRPWQGAWGGSLQCSSSSIACRRLLFFSNAT